MQLGCGGESFVKDCERFGDAKNQASTWRKGQELFGSKEGCLASQFTPGLVPTGL